MMSYRFEPFDAVIVPDGRIGMIVEVLPEHGRRALPYARVQFGAKGPFANYRLRRLSFATYNEVRDANMLGVGGLTIASAKLRKE
jgi:hypothetical protein